MRREFLFNIIFLIGINILIKPFYTFFIETEVQNLVGPSEYGIYFSLFNLSYIFQIFLDLGIHNFGSQYLAKNSAQANGYLSKALSAKALLTLLFGITVLLLGWILGYNGRMIEILWYVSINQIFIALIFFFRSSLAALGHYRSNSFISVVDKILMISAFSYILFIASPFGENFSIYHFIGIRMIAYLLTTVIALLLLLKVGRINFHLSTDLKGIKNLIKDSLPFAILVVFMGLCNRTDAVMLERLLDDGGLQSGIYAAAYRIYYAINTLGFLFSMLLLPMFANLIESNRTELLNLVDLSLKSILALAIGAVSILYLLRVQIMNTLYKEDASIYGTEILVLLALTFILTSIIYVLGTLLTANARLKCLNYVFIIATIINVSINVYLIPRYGAIGAAWATLMTEIAVVIAQFVLCYYIVPLRLSTKSIVGTGVFLLAITASTLAIDHYIHSLSMKTLYMAVIILSTGLITNVIDIKALKELLSRA